MRKAFEKAILENPDELAGYAAYADWLSEQGDPRGEFMQVQLALEDEALPAKERKGLQKRERELLNAHQQEWLGPLAPWLLDNSEVTDPEVREARRNSGFRFARGFLDTLHIGTIYVPLARALRDAPQTAFLRELVIESIAGEGEGPAYEPGDDVPTWEEDHIQFVSIYPLLGRRKFEGLRRLRIGTEEDMDGFLTNRYAAQSHAWCNPAAELVERMPRLEELHLLCKDYDVNKLFSTRKLKQMRVLRIYHLGVQGADRRERPRYEYPLEVLAKNPTFANLTHLLFHPHHEEYHPDHYGRGRQPSFLPLEQVRALVRSPHLPKLTHLQLRLSNMGDEGCEELVRSGTLGRLKWLDLRHGCVTDKGAAILAACPDLPRLEHLDLSRNALTRKGIAALRATGVNLRADNQLTADELAEEAYLFEGDSE
jgi:uncharacterized protein (TIGR02996 family)